MNRFAWAAGLAAIGVCILPSVHLLEKTYAVRKQIHILGQKVKEGESRIDDLSELDDGPVRNIEDYSREIAEYLRIWSENFNVRSLLVFPLANSHGAVTSVIQPSSWEGIDALDLKINFEPQPGQNLNIFQFAQEIQREYPVQILGLSENTKGIEISIRLYGAKH